MSSRIELYFGDKVKFDRSENELKLLVFNTKGGIEAYRKDAHRLFICNKNEFAFHVSFGLDNIEITPVFSTLKKIENYYHSNPGQYKLAKLKLVAFCRLVEGDKTITVGSIIDEMNEISAHPDEMLDELLENAKAFPCVVYKPDRSDVKIAVRQ